MATRIECINKQPRNDPYRQITHIGGTNSDGKRWTITQDKAIEYIESGRNSFDVEYPLSDRVEVVVAISAAGNKYIKTVADGDEPNNLLSLPECP